jgi:hypothetical protein
VGGIHVEYEPTARFDMSADFGERLLKVFDRKQVVQRVKVGDREIDLRIRRTFLPFLCRATASICEL